MFVSGVRELVRPQWVAILEELKRSGGLAVPDLAKEIGMSYMGTKQHCEKLEACGYVERRRLPRSQVGRPEILYRLSEKAEAIFPYAGLDVLLSVLDAAARLFGDTAPEKLVHRHLLARRDDWKPVLEKAGDLAGRAKRLVALRAKTGCLNRFCEDEKGLRIEEFHHPLEPIFERWPGLRGVETRMFEELLGTRLLRNETEPSPGHAASCVVYEFITLGRRGEIRHLDATVPKTPSIH